MWPWGHPHSQNYRCLPKTQVYLNILCFISLDLTPLAGAGEDMDPSSAEEPACPP